jgi:hypothetical protein
MYREARCLIELTEKERTLHCAYTYVGLTKVLDIFLTEGTMID